MLFSRKGSIFSLIYMMVPWYRKYYIAQHNSSELDPRVIFMVINQSLALQPMETTKFNIFKVLASCATFALNVVCSLIVRCSLSVQPLSLSRRYQPASRAAVG